MSTLTLNDSLAELTTPEGIRMSLDVPQLLKEAVPARAHSGGLLPGGIRYVESAGPFTVWVLEVAPTVRELSWLANDSPAPFGKEATYRCVKIALPYLLVVAVFENGLISEFNECFFRTQPLRDENADELCYPALLNCSKFTPPEGRPLAWICTQKLNRAPLFRETNPRQRMIRGLQLLHHCLFETGFNRSSDVHEGASWFTQSCGCDPRIATIEKWQEATAKNPLFVLDVPWLKTGVTLTRLIDRIFANRGVSRDRPVTTGDLARIVMHRGKAEGKS